MNVVLLLVLVTMIDVSVSRASSDFYYDNWQCNHYLSAQSVVVDAAPGHLLELHVRDDIPVSMSNCMLPADSLSRLHLPTYTFAYVLFSSLVDQFLRHDAMHSADYAIADVRPFVGLSGGLSDCQCQTPAFCQKRLHISSNFFHCWVLVFLYHTAWQYSTAASNARRYEKNHDFRSISRFISEMMQDRVIVTMDGE